MPENMNTTACRDALMKLRQARAEMNLALRDDRSEAACYARRLMSLIQLDLSTLEKMLDGQPVSRKPVVAEVAADTITLTRPTDEVSFTIDQVDAPVLPVNNAYYAVRNRSGQITRLADHWAACYLDRHDPATSENAHADQK